jgi:hypothetical protein
LDTPYPNPFNNITLISATEIKILWSPLNHMMALGYVDAVPGRHLGSHY